MRRWRAGPWTRCLTRTDRRGVTLSLQTSGGDRKLPIKRWTKRNPPKRVPSINARGREGRIVTPHGDIVSCTR